MGRQCTVCAHKDLEEINKLLLCSDSYRDLARQFGLSKDALARHKESHIPTELLKSNDIQEIAKADVLLVQLEEIREKTLSLLDKAERAADTRVYGAPVAYLREVREQIKLLAELEGRLASQPQITIINNPQWIVLRTQIIGALEPYPEAREAVIHAIRE
ncbi:MAG: hypothetical protein PHQ41_02490 [Candidatus Cloacimonetes bacterium]|jgi:hypothetical protein|nr:hypothetical protein [Candidatus Cloacimonadota bacterium]